MMRLSEPIKLRDSIGISRLTPLIIARQSPHIDRVDEAVASVYLTKIALL